jgi:adenine-specific DNA-methyltransferase
VKSLAAIRAHTKKSSDDQSFVQTPFEVENFVNTAAFVRMLKDRGIEQPTLDRTDSPRKDVVELFESLVAACPLNEFAEPEVLGSVHEYLVSFRGRALAARQRGAASRKANGVFYTPDYVVNEIVEQTLGRQLKQLGFPAGQQIKILDPAGGCGAFLVHAYRFLLQWHLESLTACEDRALEGDLLMTDRGWRLSFRMCEQILMQQVYGVDADAAAIRVTRRILWLTMIDSSASHGKEVEPESIQSRLSTTIKYGNSLIGPAFSGVESYHSTTSNQAYFDWSDEFPLVCESGGFDVIIGNPPYRRERDFKNELDKIATTPLGQYRCPRMDLWYYFVHRGIQLLKEGGTLSYITNAYWLQGRGSDKLLAALRDEVHLDEVFVLRNQPIFEGMTGQHSIFRLTKSDCDDGTTIKVVPGEIETSGEAFFRGTVPVQTLVKTRAQLFVNGQLNIHPVADQLLRRLNAWPGLGELGEIRQGIAENPATINRRTRERFSGHEASAGWNLGEGVFSLTPAEVDRLNLTSNEAELLRPYHDLCDLQRYWAATTPSRSLIYSTRDTCPEIATHPTMAKHLARFKAILDSRRETRNGGIRWWHLHWPRSEHLWRADKLVAIQMAIRPSFATLFGVSYVPFSTNVFIADRETKEDLRYLCGLLNSRVLWAWFVHHAKRRGIGLELNGHTLERVPIRRIRFDHSTDKSHHDTLVSLVQRRMDIELQRRVQSIDDNAVAFLDVQIHEIEGQIDSLVASLYDLDSADLGIVTELTGT